MRPWGLLHSLSNVTKEALLLQADVVVVVVVAVRRGRLQPGVRQRLIVAGVAAVAAGDRQGLAQASGWGKKPLESVDTNFFIAHFERRPIKNFAVCLARPAKR